MMISPTLDVDWELRESGPAEARHGVLLLPGGACSAAFYNELAAEPALAGLRLVAATLPGHAGTPAPSDLSTQNYGRLAAQLTAVKHCDTVFGFSMGSTVALYLHDLRREPLIGDRLRALDVPVWIVHADKGDGRLTTQERRSLEECPNVSVVTIPGRSFFLPNEHPAQLAALIVEALATVSATPAATATPTPPPRHSTG